MTAYRPKSSLMTTLRSDQLGNRGARLIGLLLFSAISCHGFPGLCAEPLAPVGAEQATALGDIIDAALVTQWEQSGRGFAQAKITTEGWGNYDAEVMMWWEEERCGYDYLRVEHDTYSAGSGTRSRVVKPRLIGCWSPKEHWQYQPELTQALGYGGRLLRNMDDILEIRPRMVWLSFPMSSKRHYHTLFRAIRPMAEVFVAPSGNIIYHTELEQLEFSPACDYRLVRDELTNPTSPMRIDFDLDQDRHGVWYCKLLTHRFQGQSATGEREPVCKRIEILSYDSRPAKHEMKLSLETLSLPRGTRMQGTFTARKGTWTYGDDQPDETIGQPQLERLIEEAKTTGFSAVDREESTP